MKFALSVWVVAFSFCKHAFDCGQAMPHVTLDGRQVLLLDDLANKTLKNGSNAIGGSEIAAALEADATPLPLSLLQAQSPSNLTATAQPQQEQSNHTRSQNQVHRLNLHSHSAHHQMTMLEHVDTTHHARSQQGQINHTTQPDHTSRVRMHSHSAHLETSMLDQMHHRLDTSRKGKHDNQLSTLFEVQQGNPGNLGMTSEDDHQLDDVIVPKQVRRLRLRSRSAHHEMTLAEQVDTTHNKVHKGKDDKEQPMFLERQQRNAGKPKKTTEERERRQPNSSALLESRRGKIRGVGAGNMVAKDKLGNMGQQFAFSDVMSWQPHPLTAGVQAVICLAGVLMLLWMCSCCLYAQGFFSERAKLEDRRSHGSRTGTQADGRVHQDSEDVEEEGNSRTSGRSTSSQGKGKIASFISKGKRARGASGEEKYKFGDMTRGFLSSRM